MDDILREIEYRNVLFKKLHSGEKLTKKERFWLYTHSTFNFRLGYPYYQTSIETIEKRTKYKITLDVEQINYSDRIFPILYVPVGKGEISSENLILYDIDGKKTALKKTKMLAFLTKETGTNTVEFFSEFGILGIAYQARYFDDKQNIFFTESSMTGNAMYAMLKEEISDNTRRFRCKSPLSDEYDALIFTVAWETDT